jgi:hypothetical protein
MSLASVLVAENPERRSHAAGRRQGMCGPHESSCFGGRYKQLGMVIMPYAGF